MNLALIKSLHGFQEISLSEMGTIALENRIESKFIIPEFYIPALLDELKMDYQALAIQGNKLHAYHTRYFDTNTFQMYSDHHNGKCNRMKIRARLYKQTGDCFIEIKQRVKEYQSTKSRISIPALPTYLNNGVMPEVLRNVSALEPKLDNTFNRITLCDRAFSQRITVDTDISWYDNNRTKSLSGLAIIELKQYKINYQDRLVSWLHKQHIQQRSFSKYSMGVAFLYPQLKHNNFKPILIHLNKYASITPN